jgi:hypothetical protein
MAGFPVYLCRLCEIGLFQWYKGARGQGNRDLRNRRLPQQARANRITITSRRD